MSVHHWSRTAPGLFHHFRQRWSGAICDSLNDGRLPQGFYALVEQHAIGLVPDVLKLQRQPNRSTSLMPRGGLAVADAPPKTRFVTRGEEDLYAAKANRVVVRNSASELVAVIEIISPGDKASHYALRAFVEKTADLLRHNINVLVIDLFPPSVRDPQGIHPLIWASVRDEHFELPPDKPLTLAAYVAGPPRAAYVEPVAVGDALPDMPVFLDADTYVPVPLEATYQETWERCPREFTDAVISGAA